MNVVITGTSRGIGLELARMALDAGHRLLAVARAPEKSEGLTALARQHGGRMTLLAADLREAGAGAAIASASSAWDAVDVLVNNAGILRETAAREDFMESFAVNCVAPYEVTQALLPLLRRSADPKVVHITSKMGSIAENSAGGHYAYRASKTALNMVNRSLSRDHGWLTTLVVHPGWVKTDMGGSGAPVATPDSAAGIWGLTGSAQRAMSGRFFDYQGNELPW